MHNVLGGVVAFSGRGPESMALGGSSRYRSVAVFDRPGILTSLDCHEFESPLSANFQVRSFVWLYMHTTCPLTHSN